MTLQNKRIIALVIDMLLIGLLASLLSNFITLKEKIGSFHLLNTDFIYGFSLIFILYLLYFYLFDFFNNGVTLGKSLLKIKIIEKKGLDLSIASSLSRSTLKVLNIILFPLTAIFYLINGFTIHDRICGTKTIDNSVQNVA